MGKEILKATRKKIHHLYKDVLVSTWLKYFKVLEIWELLLYLQSM